MRLCPNCYGILDEDPGVCPYCGFRRPIVGWDREEHLGRVLLDRYEIVQRIGAGTTGAVYVAHDRRAAAGAPSRVAIKILHPRWKGDQGLIARFRREALASCQVVNPHVVRTLAYDELDDGTTALLMELVEGRSLQEALEEHGPLAPTAAVDIALQVALALEAAHAAGIVHRDLKPGNILLARDEQGRDQVKVLDFGFALIKDRERGAVKLTGTGIIVGTPLYMAPEQTERRAHVDHRSDLYALGVLLYRMITGAPPFDARTTMELILKHRSESPLPLRERRADIEIPPALEAVVLKLLAKRPEDRYSNAIEVRRALWPFSSAERGRVAPAVAEDERCRSRRRRLLWGLAAVILAATVAAVLVFT